MRVREPRSRLRLELVAGEVLGLERQGLREVALEVGGALAGDPVDEIERDVVEPGITKKVHGTPDVVRRGAPLEHVEQVRLEALRTERDAVHCSRAQEPRRARGSPSRGSPRRSAPRLLEVASRSRASSAGSVNVGVPPPRKTVSSGSARTSRSSSSSGEQRVDVRAVLLSSADDGDEVAVPAAVRAERQMDVQVPDVTHGYFFRSESRFKTARKASCGTSTPPTCFIRFFPFFCFSRSFRLRVMSPP